MQRRQLLIAGLLSPLLCRAQSGTKLTVAAFPAVDAIAKAARAAWQVRAPGVDLDVVSRAMVDHHTAMVTSIATHSHLPDVMAIELSYLGRFAGSGALEDLAQPAFGAGGFRAQYVPFAVQQATTTAGALVALPTDVAPGTLFYRLDRLDQAGIDLATLTGSWESFVAGGARLKARTGAHLIAHARELKDVIVRANMGPQEGAYVDAAGKVLVDSPRFHRAFELARQVRVQGLDARITAWSSEWAEGLRRGTIATQMMGSWLAGHLASWLAPATAGLWRAAQLPDGVHCAWGGTFYAIPKGARNPRLALEFIKLMTLDAGRQLAAFAAEDAFPALLATYGDGFFAAPIPFLGGQQARLLWRDAARSIQPFSVHRLDPIATEIVDSALDDVLGDGVDIPTALGEAQRMLERRAERA
jgi:multiple sugar transport system substrate-binding protein